MSYDPPSPLTIVRGFFGVAVAAAALAVAVGLARTGRLDWRFVTLTLFLWGLWGFAASFYNGLLVPVGEFLQRAFFAGTSLTIEEETRWLEDQLARPDLDRYHEILNAIRLAEIYRKRFHDKSRADALLDQLLVKYPDSPELDYARHHPA